MGPTALSAGTLEEGLAKLSFRVLRSEPFDYVALEEASFRTGTRACASWVLAPAKCPLIAAADATPLNAENGLIISHGRVRAPAKKSFELMPMVPPTDARLGLSTELPPRGYARAEIALSESAASPSDLRTARTRRPRSRTSCRLGSWAS
jgi:hypothetical protein